MILFLLKPKITKNSAKKFVKMAKKCFGRNKIADISVPSDRILTINSLLDSSHRDASNGGKFKSLASIDGEIVP